MTTSYCRHSPFLSREGNVPHAFLCYTDRLEVCGWRVDKERFYKKGHRVTSVCFPVFKHRGIHYPTKFADFSPERETCCMLSFAIQTGQRYAVGGRIRNVFIKRAIYNILLLSLIPTQRILLSTIRRQRPGWQQYGNHRFPKVMDLQPMTTRYCRHSPFLSRTGKGLHAFLFLAFLFLRFRKVEEV